MPGEDVPPAEERAHNICFLRCWYGKVKVIDHMGGSPWTQPLCLTGGDLPPTSEFTDSAPAGRAGRR